ncbi:MAG TPA: zinc-finger domain-containing protein [Burkholderiales bacterium]
MADPRQIEVSEKDLPLHCPQPDAPLWSRHPRVFLDVTRTGEALCPYCGTRFRFAGKKPNGH